MDLLNEQRVIDYELITAELGRVGRPHKMYWNERTLRRFWHVPAGVDLRAAHIEQFGDQLFVDGVACPLRFEE